MLVISWFIGGILYFLLYSYLFCEWTCKEKYKINYKIIIFSIMIGILYYFINEYGEKFGIIWIRPLILHIYFLFTFLYLYDKKIIETLLTILCILILTSISEFLFGFVAVLIFKIDGESFVLTPYGCFISNIVICIIVLLLNKIPFVKKTIKNIIDWYNRNTSKTLMIFTILCIGMLTFLLYNTFVNILPNSFLWLTNTFFIGVIVFVTSYFKEKANNNRIITEYDQLLKYVKKYEKLMEEKSKNQHEYKNQLILIKNMINKTNKKAINYIDSLYKEENDDENIELLKKLQYIPSGGLKGLIYYKIEEMFENKINVFVDISPQIKNTKLNKKLDNNLKDISKIIGVYLDNAIEASSKSKEKFVVLEIYVDNNEWVFSLSNTYDDIINVDNMDNEGYTTKGEGKGYGLSLANDIIVRNPNFRQERELKGIYFVQRLYMKK